MRGKFFIKLFDYNPSNPNILLFKAPENEKLLFINWHLIIKILFLFQYKKNFGFFNISFVQNQHKKNYFMEMI